MATNVLAFQSDAERIAAHLRELENRIDKGTSDDVRLRWESGRELLKLREGRKQLPNGVLDMYAEELGKSRSELNHRMRFVVKCEDEDEVSNVIRHFKTWLAITQNYLPKKEREMVEKKIKVSPRRARVVQRNVDAISKFAEKGVPITDEEICSEVGIANNQLALDKLLHSLAHIPWLTVEKQEAGRLFRIDAELKTICEWRQPREELGGISHAEFYANMRQEITRRRKENNAQKLRRNWNHEGTLKIELIRLIDWIESELDKINPG